MEQDAGGTRHRGAHHRSGTVPVSYQHPTFASQEMLGDGTRVFADGLHGSGDDGCTTTAFGCDNGVQFTSDHHRDLSACRRVGEPSIVNHEWIMLA